MNTNEICCSNTIHIGDGDVAIGCKGYPDGSVEITFGLMEQPRPIGEDCLGRAYAERTDYKIITDNLQSMQVLQHCVDAAVDHLMFKMQRDVLFELEQEDE